MPTGQASLALHLDAARATVAATCFPPDAPSATAVGLEVEAFPIRTDPAGAACGRLTLAEVSAVLQTVELDAALSFEPGAQLEHSTRAHPTAASCLAEAEEVSSLLATVFHRAGAVLASVGLDLWHGLVPQQLTAPRYPAMAAYLAARGPDGATMMRHTCALQVNVEAGPREVRDERWLLANLVAPIATATFACSPGPGVVSARAVAWQRLDPTRTGFPRRLVDRSTDDPVEQMLHAALDADVLLVRSGGRMEPGRPGWRFGDWMRDGDAGHGWPTVDDFGYHLTTLFHEVRPRGPLELRALDAVPGRWRPVPLVLLAGLLDDPRARDAGLGLLERHRPTLPRLWTRAATVGLADPALCAVAVELWSWALAGARRLRTGYLRPADLDLAERFHDRYTLRGRCPSDELRESLCRDAATALAWAAQPLPTPSLR